MGRLLRGRVTTAASEHVRRPSTWLLGLGPLLLIAALVVAFFAFDGPGLDRRGVPIEDVAIERTVLRPGEIRLELRNDGPDAVRIAQVIVNDAYIPTASISSSEVGRLGTSTIRIPYAWVEGQAYEIALVTSTGGTIAAPIEVAAETPAGDAGFFGLMALLGLYVGVIPVTLGLLWLPWLRRVGPGAIRFLLALTVGLLLFLAVDATFEGLEIAGSGPQAFGGPALVILGALAAFLALGAADAWVSSRRGGTEGGRLALLIALGIGLHNLGEGLAIGSAYAIGELALGAFLVVGFALHNTTEGLAVVAPLAKERPSWRRLALLGALAGAPAVLGAWIGGVAYSAPAAAVLLGVGVGAIVQVALQIMPAVRESKGGRVLTPLTAGGLAAGLAIMYATSLLVAA
jgi:zinc transporter ZupT